MAEVSTEEHDSPLRATLLDTFSFRNNRVNYSLFYAASGATLIIFIILCSLSGWSISIGTEINELVATGQETLSDVQELLPEAKDALRILREMCKHENFTKSWGNIC
ncbi:MAG: hypothetical protein CL450_07385 [Acidimicrobiaceae bacterium]|nr:hypothetical protein [Acidimicrobiaceae bacterium]